MDGQAGKQAAATYAAQLVQDGMHVGLGSGSTSELMVRALGARVREGLKCTGVPTSKNTAQLAQQFGIPLKRLDELSALDLTIDGADEVDPQLNLVKGHGGALLREKLVACAAGRFVIMVDESKLVPELGSRSPVPVEVATFGWTTTRNRLERLGLTCELRGGASHPYLTANHNYILDCRAAEHAEFSDVAFARRIKQQTGVLDHGLFLHMASTVVVGTSTGSTRILTGPLTT